MSHDDTEALAILAEDGDVLTNPAARWQRAQEIAHSASELLALKADGKHDEAEVIGRAITEALVTEADRLLKSGEVE